jgi:hypothetical protein
MLAYFFWMVYIDKDAIGEIRQIMIDIGLSEHHFNRWPFNRVIFS